MGLITSQPVAGREATVRDLIVCPAEAADLNTSPVLELGMTSGSGLGVTSL